MEENNIQGQTINLGGNMSGAVPPVFNNPNTIVDNVTVTSGYASVEAPLSVTVPEVNQTVTVSSTTREATVYPANTSKLENVQHMTSQVEKVDVQTQPMSHTPTLVSGDIIIPTVLLKEMIRVARKVGVYNNAQPQSEVLNLIINDKGITMRTSNGPDDYECIDNTFVFTSKIEASVDIKLFGDFINSVSCASVKLYYEDNSNVLIVATETGVFKFPQRMDASIQQPVITVLKYDMDYNDMKYLNYDALIEILNLTKPIRDFAKGFESIRGAYFSDIVITSDSNMILMKENDTDFRNGDFFVGGELCDLISNIEFNPLNCRVGFTRDDSGNLRGMIISDGRTKLCGPIDTQTDLPVDICKQFWNSTDFVKTISVNTHRVVNVLKSVIPFINASTDMDKISIEIDTNNMRILSNNKGAVESIPITNSSAYKTSVPLQVQAVKLYKLLQSVKTETFDIMINPNNDTCICLKYGSFKCIVGLQ